MDSLRAKASWTPMGFRPSHGAILHRPTLKSAEQPTAALDKPLPASFSYSGSKLFTPPPPVCGTALNQRLRPPALIPMAARIINPVVRSR